MLAGGDGPPGPGARPPLSMWAPVVAWVAGAAVLAVVLLAVVPEPGPLDDPDEAAQRSGVLMKGPPVGDLSPPGDPVGRRPVVLVFDRRLPDPDALERFVDGVADGALVVLAVPEPGSAAVPELPPRTRLLSTGAGRLAAATGMPEPRDGGFPVGYAIVGPQGRLRYATLDPTYLRRPYEIAVLTEALR